MLPYSKCPVLQLISSSGYYGAERVLVELALYLRESGWDSRVGVFRHNEQPIALAEESRRRGLPVIEFPCHGQCDRALPRAIAEYVTREKIGIIHSHGYKSDIYLNWAPLDPDVRRVATCHNWLSGGLKLRVYQKLDLRALRCFDRVIAVSEAVMARVRAGGVAPDRSKLIENGLKYEPAVPEAVVRARAEFTASPDDFLIMQIGRLSKEKGNDLLLRAFANALEKNPPKRSLRLVFAGDGPQRIALEQLASELNLFTPSSNSGGLPRVFFTGYRTDVPALLAACDLYAISSRDEGLPTVLLEAMAAAKLIIATRVGMIPRALNDGEAGLLIAPGNEHDLALALARGWAPEDFLASLCVAAVQRYRAHYSREVMGEKYVAAYESLLT